MLIEIQQDQGTRVSAGILRDATTVAIAMRYSPYYAMMIRLDYFGLIGKTLSRNASLYFRQAHCHSFPTRYTIEFA